MCKIIKQFNNYLYTLIFEYTNAPVNSSCAQPPSPGYCGEFARLVIPSGGALANFALLGDRAFTNLGQEPTGPYPRAFDAHVVSYTNITTKRILVEKQAYWLIC